MAWLLCYVLVKNDLVKLVESGWHVYGPENGYNFPHSRLLRVKLVGVGGRFNRGGLSRWVGVKNRGQMSQMRSDEVFRCITYEGTKSEGASYRQIQEMARASKKWWLNTSTTATTEDASYAGGGGGGGGGGGAGQPKAFFFFE